MNNIEQEVALVMTASIDPKGMPAASTLPDPKVRETDYVNALDYYLVNHPRITKIVFAENSGWPLDRLYTAAKKRDAVERVEFISSSLNDFPRELGKSYGELLLLDHAIEQSRFVGGSKYIAKITGRAIIPNLTRLLESAPEGVNFYGDLRDHRLYKLLGTGLCGQHGESRVFLTTPQFYNENFRDKYVLMNEDKGIFLENLIYDVVKKSLDGKRVVGRFRIEPDFQGIAGHAGKDYSSTRETFKRKIRALVRITIPWLWI
ncbi:MAG TPA: hypothetical protein VGG19_15430 [Tepidisphaeraceae bacterium]